jgi:hypothetical protein
MRQQTGNTREGLVLGTRYGSGLPGISGVRAGVRAGVRVRVPGTQYRVPGMRADKIVSRVESDT